MIWKKDYLYEFKVFNFGEKDHDKEPEAHYVSQCVKIEKRSEYNIQYIDSELNDANKIYMTDIRFYFDNIDGEGPVSDWFLSDTIINDAKVTEIGPIQDHPEYML